MTALTPEMRHEALEKAAGMKSVMTEEEYTAALQTAEQFRGSLVTVCGSDAAAARVASTIAYILANICRQPLFMVYDELRKYVAEYTFAAGLSAEAAPDEPEEAVPYGQYL